MWPRGYTGYRQIATVYSLFSWIPWPTGFHVNSIVKHIFETYFEVQIERKPQTTNLNLLKIVLHLRDTKISNLIKSFIQISFDLNIVFLFFFFSFCGLVLFILTMRLYSFHLFIQWQSWLEWQMTTTDYRAYWTGMNDQQTEKLFRWADGTLANQSLMWV